MFLQGGFLRGCIAVTLVTLSSTSQLLADNSTTKPAQRSFRFNYGATVTGLPQDQQVRVWLPVPQDNGHQQVQRIATITPTVATVTSEPTYGNKILYFDSKAPASGQLAFNVTYRITRTEVRNTKENRSISPGITAEQLKLFLSPSRKVPLDGKPLELLSGVDLPTDSIALGRALYERVDDHVKYDKSKPGYGNGDVNWVCDSRFGNCTDFHSLFISLSRSRGVPARFEIGFPLPPERGAGTIGGYHCWAYFHTNERGWLPVDISEADKHPELKDYYFGNLTENRVAFSVERDINLVPQQAGEPLNYFVYPYVEVAGKPLPQEQIKLAFSYEDE